MAILGDRAPILSAKDAQGTPLRQADIFVLANINMHNYLVTGGAGFIGSNFVRYLCSLS